MSSPLTSNVSYHDGHIENNDTLKHTGLQSFSQSRVHMLQPREAFHVVPSEKLKRAP